jgi:hypothetical protein
MFGDRAARSNRGGLLRSRSLNGVGETTVGDFSAYAVPNLLTAAQLLGFPADIEVDVIALVIFNGVDIAFDVRNCSADGLPGRTRLTVRLDR